MLRYLTNYNPHKFSINEIFANNNGKTSSTKIVGFITSMVCLLLFISLVIYFFCNPAASKEILEFVDRTITYFSVSAGLMGIKSISSAFGKQKIELTNIDENKIKLENDNKNENDGIILDTSVID